MKSLSASRWPILIRYKGEVYEIPVTSKLRTRFFRKFRKPNDHDCWPWHGSTNGRGHGQLGFSIKAGHRVIHIPIVASRISWQLYYGEIPLDSLVLHLCNDLSCVNPTHLSLGTQSDNLRRACVSGTRPDTRKITFAQAEEIRRVYVPRDRQFGTRALGRKYGLCYQSVSLIIQKKLYRYSWKSLT
jgi:hypothetical protein